MPVTLPNFLNAQILEHPNYFKTFMDAQNGAKAQKQNAIASQLANDLAMMRNKYYPKKQEQAIEKNQLGIDTERLNLDALPDILKDEALKRTLRLEQSQRSASRDVKYGDLLAQAKLEKERALKERALRQENTAGLTGHPREIASFLHLKEQLGENHPLIIAEEKRLTETAEDRRNAALENFRQKKRIEQEARGTEDFTKPTKAVVTNNQNIVSAVNNVVPEIENLKKIKTPNLATGKYSSAGINADYVSDTDAVADSLMASFKWLGIEASLDMAKSMVKRQPLESESDYHKRLDKLVKHLISRQKNAENILKNNKVGSNLGIRGLSDEELLRLNEGL
jgi:hypothetical protein